MKDNNEQHNFDKLFKDQLGEFKAPELRSTNEETSPEENADIDQLFQTGFQEFEQTPPPKAWGNIQKELPLHLIWRKKLSVLSRVAAVLLIATLVSVLLTQESSPLYSFIHPEKVIEQAPVEATTTIADPDFVYDIQTKSNDPDLQTASKTLFQDENAKARAAQEQQALEDLQEYVQTHGELQPLAAPAIEELNFEDNAGVVQSEALKSNMTIAIPLRVAKVEEDATLPEKDILVRGTQSNPAQ